MKADLIKQAIPSESALCEFFMEEFNSLDGWICYPETGEFDILVVHESGRQIGVEAKLQLNAKVADQILPSRHWYSQDGKGPDHRLVIVRSITEANAGIAKMLKMMGVDVWSPWVSEQSRRNPITRDYEIFTKVEFQISTKLWEDDRCSKADHHNGHWACALYDWNPKERLQVPGAVPNHPAGVPAPVRMTPWKQAAVRVFARLRKQGYITTKQIAAEGCSPTVWTQKWLDRHAERGKWIETDRLPALDKQHPELFEIAMNAELTPEPGTRDLHLEVRS
ncbi:MAG: hypothetical protein Q8L20_11080 [Gammaproteobacteria bacterium]|nr:hypothetical protein [Gammaproteobacteria bacterium]